MLTRPARLYGAVVSLLVLGSAGGLAAGCGGSASSTVAKSQPTSPSLSKVQAAAYSRSINLQSADLPGFEVIGGEAEAPPAGPNALRYQSCRGANPARRVADISSAEFTSGKGISSAIFRSSVEVWPTPALVTRNSNLALIARGQTCLIDFLKTIHRRMNEERKGKEPIGPFTLSTVPRPLPGTTAGFQTTIVENLLRYSGALRAHVYREIFGFIVGPAEINLEAIGFVHPVSPALQAKELLLLLKRAKTAAL